MRFAHTNRTVLQRQLPQPTLNSSQDDEVCSVRGRRRLRRRPARAA